MAYPYDESDPFAQPDQPQPHFQPPPYGHINGEPLPVFPFGYPPLHGGIITNRPQQGHGHGQQDETSSNPSDHHAQSMQHMQHILSSFGDEPQGGGDPGDLAEVAEVIQSWYGANHNDVQQHTYTPWMPSPYHADGDEHQQHRATPPVPPPLQQPHPDPEPQVKDEPNDHHDPLAYLNGLTKSEYNPFTLLDNGMQASQSDTSLPAGGGGTWRMTVDPFPFSSGLEGAHGVPLQTIQHNMRPDVLAKHSKDVEELQSYLDELISLMAPFAFTPSNPSPPPPPPYLHTRIARFAALIRDKLLQLETSSQTSLDPNFLDLPPNKADAGQGGMSQAEKDMEFIRRRRDVLNAKARRDAQVAYVRPTNAPQFFHSQAQAQRILPLPQVNRCRACGGNMRGDVCEGCYRRRGY